MNSGKPRANRRRRSVEIHRVTNDYFNGDVKAFDPNDAEVFREKDVFAARWKSISARGTDRVQALENLKKMVEHTAEVMRDFGARQKA
ncbi:MAG: hypothetical protein AMXMBFR58_18880 [Phycisphaerae bacterium]